MRDYYIVYNKKILYGPMRKETAILKLFQLSSTFKGLRVRSYFGKHKPTHARDDMPNNDTTIVSPIACGYIDLKKSPLTHPSGWVNEDFI